VYLIAAAWRDDPGQLTRERELWRRVRRFNLPVQLAVAAAEEAASAAADASRAGLISLAPCRSGSPELFAHIAAAEEQGRRGSLDTPRVNPTLTFHAVDNLALSALAIHLGNRAYGLGLGGAPGQAWVALEVMLERSGGGEEEEVLVVAGDQDETGEKGQGVALLFARRPAPSPLGNGNGGGRPPRLLAVERRRLDPEAPPPEAPTPHAAAGLLALLAALGRPPAPGPSLRWDVPPAHGDGRDHIRLCWELG